MADGLSRKGEEECAALALISFPYALWLDELKRSYALCPEIKGIYDKLQLGSEDVKNYSLQQGLLLRKSKIVWNLLQPLKTRFYIIYTTIHRLDMKGTLKLYKGPNWIFIGGE